MSTVPILSDPYYARILKTYFSWTTEDERMVYWQRFAESKGFTSTPSDTDALRAEFSAFLSKYKSYGLTLSSLEMDNSIPTGTSFYTTVLDTFFNGESAVTKKNIWNRFLESQGLTSNPPDTLDIREAFSAFVKVTAIPAIAKTLDDYFGTYPLSFRYTLWERFAESKGSTSLILQSSDENLADFSLFVQRYNALGIRPDTFVQSGSIPASPSFYQNYMSAFFGNLTAVEQKDIWNSFLTHYGYSSSFTDSIEAQQNFAHYMQSLNSTFYNFQSVTLLSPKEMESRVIMTSVLSSLKSFLNATEQQIKAQSATLMFYGQWQQNYTEMMTRIPNLTGGQGAPKINTNVFDLSKFTFGYNDISLSEVIRWGVNEALKKPATPALFGNASPLNYTTSIPGEVYTVTLGQYSFNVTTTGNIKKITVGIQHDLAAVNATRDIVIENPAASPPIFLSESEIASAVEDKFKELFNAYPTFAGALTGQTGIPGRYLGLQNPSGDPQITTNNRELENRAEANAKLQQYVENLRSQRDSIRNLSSQLQSALNQSREGINQQTSLWTAILESIDSIMSTILKKSK